MVDMFYICVCVYMYVCIYICTIFSLGILQFWVPQLVPQLGCCEESCNEHGCAGVSLLYQFVLLRLHAQGWYDGIIRKVHFQIFGEPPY
jgi:hypothetical protein